MLSISNPAGIRRLTIGITSPNGTRAEMKFVAPAFTSTNRYTPLVAVETEIESAATPSSADEYFEALLPTEDEITRDYLLRHDWKIVDSAEYAQFIDPIGGESVCYLEACNRQDERDLRDYVAENARALAMEQGV